MKRYRYNIVLIDRDNPDRQYSFKGLNRTDINQVWYDGILCNPKLIVFLDKEEVEDDE